MVGVDFSIWRSFGSSLRVSTGGPQRPVPSRPNNPGRLAGPRDPAPVSPPAIPLPIPHGDPQRLPVWQTPCGLPPSGPPMHLEKLKRKSPADLLAFAEELQIENASVLRKQDMMFAILKQLAENEVPI